MEATPAGPPPCVEHRRPILIHIPPDAALDAPMMSRYRERYVWADLLQLQSCRMARGTRVPDHLRSLMHAAFKLGSR